MRRYESYSTNKAIGILATRVAKIDLVKIFDCNFQWYWTIEYAINIILNCYEGITTQINYFMVMLSTTHTKNVVLHL